MNKLFTSISEEISYYVVDDITEKLNISLQEMKNFDSYNVSTIINKRELEITKNHMKKVRLVSLRLDYISIDYVKDLAYLFKVPEFYIYDIFYRKILESLNGFRSIT